MKLFLLLTNATAHTASNSWLYIYNIAQKRTHEHTAHFSSLTHPGPGLSSIYKQLCIAYAYAEDDTKMVTMFGNN